MLNRIPRLSASRFSSASVIRMRSARTPSSSAAPPRTRRASGARSFANSGIQGSWPGVLPRDPPGPGWIEGEARMVGDDLRRVERRARLGREVEDFARQRILPGRKRQDVVRDGPALPLAHRVAERGHRRAVEAEGHRAEDVADGRAALELTAGEVGRADRKLEVVGQLRRRLAIAFALLAVALEALGLLAEILAARDDLRRCLRRLADRR